VSSSLFFTTRPITGREGKSVVAHMSILRSNGTNVDYLSCKKTDKTSKFISSYANIHINKNLNIFGEFYEKNAINMSNWKEVYDSIDISPLSEYKNLYIIGGVDLWRSNLTRGSKRNGVFPLDRGQLKWQSCGVILTNLLALLKAHRTYDIPLHELAFDPNEMSLDLVHEDYAPNSNNYHLYHGYDIKEYNTKRLDSLQFHFNNKNDLFEVKEEKIYDLTFGYSVLENSKRDYALDYVDQMSPYFSNTNIFCKNYVTGEDSLVDRDTYLDYIKKSKFTLVLPSYDQHCFSIYRFIESLHNNCLPIINEMCNISDVQISFDVDLTPLIMYDKPNESKRLEMLEYYKHKFLTVEKGFR